MMKMYSLDDLSGDLHKFGVKRILDAAPYKIRALIPD